MKVLAFGEILWDVIEGNEHLGGAPFNFAAHSVQCGNESFIISRIGNDHLGIRAFNKSKAYGVDISLIQWDEFYPTGIVDVTLSNGQPDYIIRQNVAYDFITPDGPRQALEKHKFDVFYFGSLAQRTEVSRFTLKSILAANQFRHIFYDVNLRKSGYTEAIVQSSLGACTIFKLNCDEVPIIANLLTGASLSNFDFCRCVQEIYPNIDVIIITASEKGCFIFIDGKFQAVPGTPVEVVDAVGAGDAFSASFMHIYTLCGDALKSALIANHVGAYVATQTGAIPAYSPLIKEMLNLHTKEVS